MYMLINFFIILSICTLSQAQLPPRVTNSRNQGRAVNYENHEISINTDRLVSSIEHKLSNSFRVEVGALRQLIEKSDHSNSYVEIVQRNYEALKNSLDQIQAECLQNQIFDTQPTYLNASLSKLENYLVVLRGSTTRMEKDLAIVKKTTRLLNGKGHAGHSHMLHPRSDLFFDHENVCTSAEINTDSGIVKIRKDFFAYCEISQDDGNWIVIQNRFDGSINFFRNWNEYKDGFGNLAGEFWMGLEKIYELTSTKLHELLIVMELFNGVTKTARYSAFGISGESGGYALSILGKYSGDAGDALSYHAGMKFSTFDIDNDEWTDGSCAKSHFGGWWYNKCDKSNLNGIYFSNGIAPDASSDVKGMHWKDEEGTTMLLKSIKIMIRPVE